MRFSRSLLVLVAVAFAGLLAVPAAASTRPTQSSLVPTLVQRMIMHHNGQSGPVAASAYQPQQIKLPPPTLQNGPGPKPKKKDPYSALFLVDFGSEDLQFYDRNNGPNEQPWLYFEFLPDITTAVDKEHNTYVSDESGGDFVLPRGNLDGYFFIDCFCEAFGTAVDHKGNLYISEINGEFGNCICDVIYEFAHGTYDYVQTLYFPNMKAPLFMAFDSQDDMAVAGFNHANTAWVIDKLPAGSTKAISLSQFSTPSYDQFVVAFDKDDNLLVGDFDANTVGIYAKPYTKPALSVLHVGIYMNGIAVSTNPQTIWLGGYNANDSDLGAAWDFSMTGSPITNTNPGSAFEPGGVALDPGLSNS